MPRRLKALRPLLTDPGMSAAGLIGTLTGPLSRPTLPTASGNYGANGFNSSQSRSLDGSLPSIGSPIHKGRPSSGNTSSATALGRGRQAYSAGYSSVTYSSAVQGLPEAVQSQQLRANAPEFIPRGTTHIRSMRRLWEPREAHTAARPVSSGTCRMYSSSSGRQSAVTERTASSIDEPTEGRLIEYQKDSKCGLALLLKRDGKRNWTAVDTRGTAYSLRPQQLVYILPGEGYTQEDLQTVATAAQAACSDDKLMELAWEVVTGSEETYDVPGMAELLFGEVTVSNAYAAHRLLNEDRTFFKQVNRGPPRFQPRPQTEVKSLQAKAAAEAKAARDLAECGAALREAKNVAAADESAASWLSGPFAHRIRAVEAFALQRADAKETQLALETLQAAGVVPGAGGAAALLGRIGVWGPHDNIGLRQLNMTREFAPALEEAAAALLASPPPDADESHRLDLTHHRVVTIDDAATTEVDDGLSVEFLEDGRARLWVHVADPTRWIRPEAALDFEARRRGSTMYLPTGAIFMFPGRLAEGPFSLREGERCCALSISAELSPDGELSAHSVAASHVTPTQRMTYDQVDAAIASGDPEQLTPDLRALLQASEARQAWRTRQGAANISLDECEVRVSDARAMDPRVTLERVATWDSPARTLVSEMMILAGQVAATVGREAMLPLPYRGQAKAVLPSEAELEGVPEGPCRAVLLRSRMVRGVATTHDALPHAGLGLPAYVQVTSPIRRYSDLLAHWQLKAHLRGEQPPWGVHALSVLLDDVTATVREHITLEREITNYWIAKYFEAEKAADPARTWPAQLLHWIRQDTGLAQVQLEESALETVVRIDRPAAVGERLQLSCASADARMGVYRLEEAYQLPSQAPQQPEGALLGYLGEPGEADDKDGALGDAGAEDSAVLLELAHV